MSDLSDSAELPPYNSPDFDPANPRPTLFRGDWSYEQTVKKVEATIARIESGELELTEVFDQFAAAVENLRECEIFLNQHQRQMDLLIETLSDQPD